MSSKLVDERVVQMNFDNKNFEKNVKQSMGTVEELKASLDFSAVEIAAVAAISNITNKFTDFSLKLVKSLSVDNLFAGFKQYEQETIAVGTLTNQLINDANFKAEILKDNVNATLEDIEEKAKSVSASLTNELSIFSDETSMSFTAMLEGINAATASGIINIEQAKESMFFISEWFTSVGKSEKDAANAYNMFARALNSGIFTHGQWQDLTTRRGITSSVINEELINSAVELGKLTKLVDGTYQTIDGKYYKLEELFQETALNTSRWLTSEVFTTTASRMSGGISDLIELVEETDGSISDLVQDTDIMNDVFDDNNIAKNLIKTTVEARTLTQAMDSVKISVTSAWKNIFKSIFGTYEEAKELWTKFSLVMWSQFVDPLKNVENILADWKERGGWDVLFGMDEEKAGVLWKLLNNLFNIVNAIFGGVKELFKTTGESLYDATVNFSKFIDKITPSEEFLSSVSKISSGIFKTIRNIISSVKPIITPVMKLFGVVADNIGIITTNITKMFESNKFFERMAGYLTVITEKISELFNNIASNENVTKFFEKLGDILGGILEIFMSLTDIVGEFFTNFKIIGENTIDGYVDGVKQGSSKVVKTVKSIATSVVDTFKKVLDINSPSKVTERIGENTGQGFIKGLEKEEDKILEVSSNVISAFIKDIKEKIKAFNETDGNIFEKFSAAFKLSWTNISSWWENDKFLHKIGEFFKKLGLWFAAAYEMIKVFAQENKIFERMGSMLESVGNVLVYLFTKVLDLLARISDKIKEFNDNVIATDASDSIFNSLYELALSLGRVFLFIIDIIQSFIDKIVEVLNETTDGDIKDSPFYGLMQSLGELFKAVLNLLGRIAPLLTAVIDKITESINGLAQTTEDGEEGSAMPVLKAFFESLSNLFKIMVEMLTSVFESLTTMMSTAKDSEKIKGLTKTIGIILAVLLGLKLLIGIFWNMSITKKILSPLKSFTVLMDSLAGYLDAARLAFFGKMLLYIGEGIALIIAAIISVSNLKWEQLWPGIAIIGGIFAAIIALIIIINVSNRKILKLSNSDNEALNKDILSNYKKLSNRWMDIGLGLILMAAAIDILVHSCITLNKEIKANTEGTLQQAFFAILIIMNVLAGGMALINVASKNTSRLGLDITAIGASLYLIISAIAKLARLLSTENNNIDNAIEVIKPFLYSLEALMVIFVLISSISSKFLDKAEPITKSIISFSGAILAIAGAIVIIVHAIKSLSYIKKSELEKVTNIVANIAGFIGVLTIVISIIEAITSIKGNGIKSSSAVAKQLIAVSISISLMIGALLLIINVLNGVEEDVWKDSINKLAVIGAIVALLAIALELVDGLIGGLKLKAAAGWGVKPIILTTALIAAFAGLLWFIKDQKILTENPGWLLALTAVVGASIAGILLVLGFVNTLGNAEVIVAKGTRFGKTLLSIMAALGILSAIVAALTGLAAIIENNGAWKMVFEALGLFAVIITALIATMTLLNKMADYITKLSVINIKSLIITLVSLTAYIGALAGFMELTSLVIKDAYKFSNVNEALYTIMSVLVTFASLIGAAFLLAISINKLASLEVLTVESLPGLIMFFVEIIGVIGVLEETANMLEKNERIFGNTTLINNFAKFAITLAAAMIEFATASVIISAYSKYIVIALGIMAAFAGVILLYANSIDKLSSSTRNFSGVESEFEDTLDSYNTALEESELSQKKIENSIDENDFAEKMRHKWEKVKIAVSEGGSAIVDVIDEVAKDLAEAIAIAVVDFPTYIAIALTKHRFKGLYSIADMINEAFTIAKDKVLMKKKLSEYAQELVDEVDPPKLLVELVIDEEKLSSLQKLVGSKYQLTGDSTFAVNRIESDLGNGGSSVVNNNNTEINITVNESNTPEETADAVAKKLLDMSNRQKALYN